MSSSDVEQIKSRIAIHELIGEYLSLEKSGGQFKALCPFHNEKSASMHISPDRGTYYCFGCGAKGDAISFVQEMEGLDFKGALTLLADRLGIVLSQSKSTESKDKKERMYTVMEDATRLFESCRNEDPEKLTYLYERGLSKQSIKDFRIGIAPKSWDTLLNSLSKKYEKSELLEMGLIKDGDKKPYDRFRGRYMFPIMDAAGRVIAFSGRIAPEYADDEAAKYMNSPETMLFHKSDVLYGYHAAKQAIRDTKRVIVVEGQMDLVMSHQANVKEAVALSGTALTDSHIDRLRYLIDEVVLALDGDSAGIRAALKSGISAFKKGLRVSVVILPSKKDPADIIKEDARIWHHAIEKRVPIIEHYTFLSQKKAKNSEELMMIIRKVVLPLIAAMEDEIQKERAASHVAKVLEVSTDAILKEAQKQEAAEVVVNTQERQQVSKPTRTVKQYQKIAEQIIAILEWQRTKENKKIDIGETQKHLAELLETKESIIETYKYKDVLAHEAELKYAEDDRDVAQHVAELFIRLEITKLQDRQQEVSKRIKDAEHSREDTTSILAEYTQITQQINTLQTKLLDY